MGFKFVSIKQNSHNSTFLFNEKKKIIKWEKKENKEYKLSNETIFK